VDGSVLALIEQCLKAGVMEELKADLKRSAQKDLQDAQTQFPSFSFSSLPSVGRTEGNEGNREQRRGI
jgi:hypothetical protein